MICVAVNMHILYERLKKALAHQTGPTERTISLLTMNMAINLVETLETYKGISETVSLFYVIEKKHGLGSLDSEPLPGMGWRSGPHC